MTTSTRFALLNEILGPPVLSTTWYDEQGNQRMHHFIHLFCGMDSVSDPTLVDGKSTLSFKICVSPTMLDIEKLFKHRAFGGNYDPRHPKIIALMKEVNALVKSNANLTKTVNIPLKGGGWEWMPDTVIDHPHIMHFSVPNRVEKVPTQTSIIMVDLYKPTEDVMGYSQGIKNASKSNFIVD
jgi:hypothetical protein